MKKILGYKFVTADLKSKNGNTQWKVGKWLKHDGELILCEKGFHACRTPKESFEFVYGDRFFLIEARGEIIDKPGMKFAAREMRLVKELPLKEIAVEYAIKCAWRQLKNYESKYPKGKSVRNAILAAKKYLKKPTEKNRLVCESAASAAWSAARSAESAARSAESAARSAESAALSAAWSAARSAAWSAESAARSAESAAWSAALSAAWSAARSAESAARSAESAARSAESAAWSAAWSAEVAWQEKTMTNIVEKYLKVTE